MIELKNVTKVYRMGKVDILALRGVSLTIERGEMISIIGASGSGKSTLMNMIGFLDTPSEGQYIFDGTDVGELNDNRLAVMRNREIGFVFQDYNLLSRATAVSNVELPLVYSNGAHKRQRALEALDRVGLAARAHHKPTELSGGEQQRVAIARALVNNPTVVLADEPTGNLDSSATAEILEIFQGLNEEGITVIVVTHELDIAARTKRTLRLMDGQIISDEKTGPKK
ncbi:MAG: ABC transporter ATP-binding protein [Dehalococcoidales bacterium]